MFWFSWFKNYLESHILGKDLFILVLLVIGLTGNLGEIFLGYVFYSIKCTPEIYQQNSILLTKP